MHLMHGSHCVAYKMLSPDCIEINFMKRWSSTNKQGTFQIGCQINPVAISTQKKMFFFFTFNLFLGD